MKINLRKANAIQVAINDAIKDLEFNATVSINEFQNASAEIEAASSKFSSNLLRRIALIDALYEIRKAVASANDSEGINALLADAARLEKDFQFFGTYAKASAMTDDTVINGKLEKIRNRKEEYYSHFRSETVDTSIFTQSKIEGFKGIVSTIKKQKQKLHDDLLVLNVRTEIEFSDATVATLTKENIL
jgi:hypothetical protein